MNVGARAACADAGLSENLGLNDHNCIKKGLVEMDRCTKIADDGTLVPGRGRVQPTPSSLAKRWFQNRRPLFRGMVPASVVVTSVLASANPAWAQDCDDKPELLSEEWFLAKADCGADSLVKSGASLLEGAVKNLLGAALDAYIPGVSSLIFGGDPFAEQVTRILDSISDAKDDIISAVLDNVKDETLLVSWPWIQEEVLDLTSGPLDVKMGKFPAYHANLEQVMDEVRLRLQNRENVFKLDALHTLVTLVSLHMQFKPEIAYLAAIDNRALSADQLGGLDAEQLADIDADVAYQVSQEVHTLLGGENGALDYFEELARTNKYRDYTNESFSAPTSYWSPWLPSQRKFTYDVTDQITLWDAASGAGARQENKRTFEGHCECLNQNCTSFNNCELTLPDGQEIVEEDIFTAVERHRNWAYKQTVLAVYAPIRQVLDAWYAREGRVAPIFQVDRDLESFLMTPDGETELTHLINSSSDNRTVTPQERRIIANYVAQFGWKSLTQLRYSASASSPLFGDGPPMKVYLNVIKGGLAPGEYEKFFRGQFAASFVALQ